MKNNLGFSLGVLYALTMLATAAEQAPMPKASHTDKPGTFFLTAHF